MFSISLLLIVLQLATPGIRDRTRPGIRLDMMRNKTLLRKLPDQFKPYENVFGCKVGLYFKNSHFEMIDSELRCCLTSEFD